MQDSWMAAGGRQLRLSKSKDLNKHAQALEQGLKLGDFSIDCRMAHVVSVVDLCPGGGLHFSWILAAHVLFVCIGELPLGTSYLPVDSYGFCSHVLIISREMKLRFARQILSHSKCQFSIVQVYTKPNFTTFYLDKPYQNS